MKKLNICLEKIMARRPKEFVCCICNKVFTTQQPTAKYCSIECRTHGKGLSIWTKVQSNCIVCGKEYATKKSEDGKLQNQFCSKSCQSKYIFKTSGNGMCEEVKKKISDKLTGVSLRDRGYTEEAISAWVNAGQKASVETCKGKTLEEIVGEEKAKKMKENYSEQRTGDRNFQSLKSLAKKFGCSEEDARKLTTCYGRTGDKHPMFGRILTDGERQKCIAININKYNPAVIVGKFNNIYWQGSWELEFLINCYEENIDVKRYNLPPIEYIFEEHNHRTWPDFITKDTHIIEVKGYINEKSKIRIEACKKYFGDNFIVIDSVKKRGQLTSMGWINKQIEKYGDLIKIIYIPKNMKMKTIYG